jgi:hypothetical protein
MSAEAAMNSRNGCLGTEPGVLTENGEPRSSITVLVDARPYVRIQNRVGAFGHSIGGMTDIASHGYDHDTTLR